ncbi:hypothetical protein HIM_09441 [Hirsutella minnesotensis 3608]|uniref:Amino acid transporter n=1 Tax=Hirsutella minnesotensis 3608 TaxID=1043627 RepID=A0A0F7ZGN2_9HYPO|nr:hypothetical protein HIM_09441 [Hirsutella minnesotensis 3608]
MARTNGIDLTIANYVIICVLDTLASIGITPIPSSSLVLVVMIAGSVGIPVTGIYAVIVAIDWFLDRFRTALNVSGDLYGAMAVYKITKIEDVINIDEEQGTVRRVEDGVQGPGWQPLNQLNQRVKLSKLRAYISEPLVELSNSSSR